MTSVNQQIEQRVRPVVQRRIQQLVSELTDELSALVRQAAADVVQETLGTNGASRSRGRGGALRLGGKRIRRSPDQLAATADRLRSYIAQNPGQRMEQIGEALGSTTRELRRPLGQLIDEGQIRREGEKRASRYYAGGGRKSKKSSASRKRTKSTGRRASRKKRSRK
jgi:hypothetical protein